MVVDVAKVRLRRVREDISVQRAVGRVQRVRPPLRRDGVLHRVRLGAADVADEVRVPPVAPLLGRRLHLVRRPPAALGAQDVVRVERAVGPGDGLGQRARLGPDRVVARLHAVHEVMRVHGIRDARRREALVHDVADVEAVARRRLAARALVSRAPRRLGALDVVDVVGVAHGERVEGLGDRAVDVRDGVAVSDKFGRRRFLELAPR